MADLLELRERWIYHAYPWWKEGHNPHPPMRERDALVLDRPGKVPRLWYPSGHIAPPRMAGGARLFDDAVSDQLSVDSTPVTAAPFTLTAMVNTDVVVVQTAVWLGDKDVANEMWALGLYGASLGTSAGLRYETAAGALNTVTTTSYTINTWHHICGVETSATSHKAFIDGGSKNTGVSSRAPAGADRIRIGQRGDSTPSDAFSGLIAEVGIWSTDLTDANVALSAKRVSPLLVVPQSLVFYLPIWGRYSPEIDIKGGRNLTVTGTVASAHPRVFYPSFRPAVFTPGAGTAYTKSVAGTMGALNGTLAKQGGKAASGATGAVTGTIAKLIGKPLAGSPASLSGSISKLTSRALSGVTGVLSGALTTSKLQFISLAGTAGALTGTLAKQTNKVLAGASGTVSGAITRLISRNLTGTMGALSGALTSTRIYFLSLAGAAGALTGTVAKLTVRTLNGATGAVAGTIAKATLKALTGSTGALSGTLSSTRLFVASLAGTMGALSGSIAKTTARSLAGSTGSLVGGLTRTTAKALAGAIGSSEGPLTPATFSDDAGIGTIAWSNPTNAGASDNVYVTVVLAAAETSHYLKGLAPGFAIGSAVSIVGIKVEVEGKIAVDLGADYNIQAKLVIGGVVSGSTQFNTFSTTEAYRTFGGATSLWGLTPTPAQVSASDFGVVVWSPGAAATYSVDHIRMTVYFSPGGLTGALTKGTLKALSGATGALSGAMTFTRIFFAALAGTMGALTGTLAKLTARSLTGSTGSLIGSLTKLTARSLSGTMGVLSGALGIFRPDHRPGRGTARLAGPPTRGSGFMSTLGKGTGRLAGSPTRGSTISGILLRGKARVSELLSGTARRD